MPHDSHQRFAIVPLPAGPAPVDAIAVGPLSTVMEYVPQSLARAKRDRESDRLEMHALRTIAVANLRADAVIEREREVEARADTAQEILNGAIERFVGDVEKLCRRFDAFEQQQMQAKLDELPDPDRPDDGDHEIKYAKSGSEAEPTDIDLEPDPDTTNAEDVLGDEYPGDLPRELMQGAPPQPGDYLTLGKPERQVPQLVALSDAAMPQRVMKRWEIRKWREAHGRINS
jgi:hypothetical protein